MINKFFYSRNLQPNEKEKGQSLLEMAFSMIVLLMLLGGIVDFGRLFYTYIALREAAQEGAAYASICPPGDVDNSQKIDAHVRASSQAPVDLTSYSTIMVNAAFTSTPTPGSQLYVRVTYIDFHFIMPYLSMFHFNISATAYDVALQFECPAD